LRVVSELARKLYPKGVKASPQYLENETVIRDKQLPKYNGLVEQLQPLATAMHFSGLACTTGGMNMRIVRQGQIQL
jgi:hypothetical protein